MTADDLFQFLVDRLKLGMGQLPAELKNQLRIASDELLKVASLVNRREFEVQSELLQRLQVRADELERRLAELSQP